MTSCIKMTPALFVEFQQGDIKINFPFTKCTENAFVLEKDFCLFFRGHFMPIRGRPSITFCHFENNQCF